MILPFNLQISAARRFLDKDFPVSAIKVCELDEACAVAAINPNKNYIFTSSSFTNLITFLVELPNDCAGEFLFSPWEKNDVDTGDLILSVALRN